MMTYEELWHRLTTIYDAGEAKALVRWVLDVRYGLSMADILMDRLVTLSDSDRQELAGIMARLEQGEPVQYVVGRAEFCGRWFDVSPAVLIPRPETEELCHHLLDAIGKRKAVSPLSILDIGTGSGCIAVTLAAERPESRVSAWDISAEALEVARRNAQRHHVAIDFQHVAILAAHISLATPRFSLIVSNPPYICDKERSAMARNVLEHEPHTALFVPDDDPLRFYRAIAAYGQQSLLAGGQLWLEINPHYQNELEQMLHGMGYHHIETLRDEQGKPRITHAER